MAYLETGGNRIAGHRHGGGDRARRPAHWSTQGIREDEDGPQPFAFHRTPGFGDLNWADVISELGWGGFRGSIDIEGFHDPVCRGELEMTGQMHGLHYLKRCRGGDFVPNPV